MLHFVQADVIHDHIEQMAHEYRAWVVMQAAGGQRLVGGLPQGVVFLHIGIGFAQVEETRAARRDQLGAAIARPVAVVPVVQLLLRQRQIASH